MRRTIELYYGRIKDTDFLIGNLFDTLNGLSIEQNTLNILTSDHGEGFFEHGRIGHGNSLYDEEIKVPLIFYAPGKLPKNMEVKSQVRFIDLLPTVLDLLNISIPKGLDGKSLRLFFEGRTEERQAISEMASNITSLINIYPIAIRDSRYKLIRFLEGSPRKRS